MGNIAQAFSLLFFLSLVIYIYWGFYIIRLNPKESINMLFLFGAILLSIWSFGFAAGNTAPDIETALFWKRIAAIGWTTVYSAVLHFILLLT